MTRSDQKAAERRTLERLLSALGIAATDIDEGETPDFMLTTSGKRVGVEITMYQSGATVDSGVSRRPVESEWEALELATRDFQAAHADLRNINVGLMFTS